MSPPGALTSTKSYSSLLIMFKNQKNMSSISSSSSLIYLLHFLDETHPEIINKIGASKTMEVRAIVGPQEAVGISMAHPMPLQL